MTRPNQQPVSLETLNSVYMDIKEVVSNVSAEEGISEMDAMDLVMASIGYVFGFNKYNKEAIKYFCLNLKSNYLIGQKARKDFEEKK